MAGYTRTDTSNNIADGNVVNAEDFDNEYDAIEEAFNKDLGHTHGGGVGEGAPITRVGPAQDVVVSSIAVTPKTNNAVDLGTSLLKFKDLYIDGTAYLDAATIGGTVIPASSTLVTTTASQTLTNKTLTSPVIASIVNTGTLTLPTSTDTLVGRATTDTLTNKTITNLVFDGDYTEEVFTITDGGSVDLDPSNGTIQLWTLGANRSPTANSFGSGQSMTLMIDDGSAFSITWPSVTWKTDVGTAPVLNTTGFTVIQLWKVSTTLYGARVGNA